MSRRWFAGCSIAFTIACKPTSAPTTSAPEQPVEVADVAETAVEDHQDLDPLQPGDGGDVVDPTLRVTMTPLVLTGAIHPEVARRRVRSHAAAERIRRCWEQHEPSDVTTGTFALKLGVSAKGEVEDPEASAADERLYPVARCIEAFVGELEFPADMAGTIEATLTIAPFE